MRAFVADSRKVSGAQFLEHFFGSYEAKRNAHYERCIQVIQSGGDLYGWPPMMVDHCRNLIAEREALAPVVHDTCPKSGNPRIAA